MGDRLVLLLVALTALSTTLGVCETWAHGGYGDSLGGRTCVHAHNGYSVSLSMYTANQLAQVRSGQRGPEITSSCPHLPAAGKAILVFDLSPELGDMPIAILVNDANDAVSRTVLEVPPQTYPFQVINVEMNFDRPGKYIAIVQVHTPNARAARRQGSTLHFPLSVGTGQPGVLTGSALSVTLLVLCGGVAVYTAYRRQRGQA
jgi:hypothetical protein